MNATCSSEPISYLRLERYLLDELAEAELARIDAHLAGCAACRACLDALRAEEIALRPLPVPAVRLATTQPRARGARRALAFGAGLAAAAGLLFGLRAVLDVAPPQLPADGEAEKGGELAFELVRERAGDVALDPSGFRAGDRFAVRVTCPGGAPAHVDLVVFQEGRAYFPLQAASPLRCGNLVPLPGAFQLDGDRPATVCVVLDANAPIDRAHLAAGQRAALPRSSACRELAPLP